MTGTSDYVKTRVRSLYNKGKRISEAVRELKIEGISISRATVAKYYKKIKAGESLLDKPRPGRPSALKLHHYDFIDEQITKNDELTSVGKYVENSPPNVVLDKSQSFKMYNPINSKYITTPIPNT